MKTTMILATAVLTTFCADFGGSASAASPSEAVVQTMGKLFATLKTGDRSGWNRITTPDFHIFENGQDLSREQIFALVRSIFDKGGNIEWNITKQQTAIDNALATIDYVNDGAITTEGKRVPVIWYESAVLRHSQTGWRVQFMQSERAKAVEHKG